MDAPLLAAARALRALDPLSALKDVALRNDAPALALRGIAMAQLGEYPASRKLLRRAVRAFGDAAPAARARCITAETEVALASHDLAFDDAELTAAAKTLDAHGDTANALFARLQRVRCAVLVGKPEEARRVLAELRPAIEKAPPRLAATAALLESDVAVRSLRAAEARRAIERARAAASRARLPSLSAEVELARSQLDAPVARLVVAGESRDVLLDEVETLGDRGELVIDACRREVRAGKIVVPLRARPVLLALAVALAEAAPGDVAREALVERAFGARRANESLRVRLRVEIGRLRRLLGAFAELRATRDGFVLAPRSRAPVLLLAPPNPDEATALLALLGSGEPWSTSGLAAALGKSQRSVQRALATLHEGGKVHAFGGGRTRRWGAPPPAGFATTLLLVAGPERD